MKRLCAQFTYGRDEAMILTRRDSHLKPKLHDLSAVLTSFAYRPEYLPELQGMLPTVRKHHADWKIVTGEGPCEQATFQVQFEDVREFWTLPVDLHLDGSENDFRKINHMKGWWMHEVWKRWGGTADAGMHRIMWLDADARLNGPLDFEIDAESELLAGAWWTSNKDEYPELDNFETITGGLLLFQGRQGGSAERLLQRWSSASLTEIRQLRAPTVRWLDADQERLTELVREHLTVDTELQIVKLDYHRYSGDVRNDGTRVEGALVDQWMMGRKMKFPSSRGRDWPPPEEQR